MAWEELPWTQHRRGLHGPKFKNFIRPDLRSVWPDSHVFYLQMCHPNPTGSSTSYYSSPNAARYALFKICHNCGVIQMGSHTVMVSEEQYAAIGRQACNTLRRTISGGGLKEFSTISSLFSLFSGIQTNSLSPVNSSNKSRTHHTKCTCIPVVTRQSIF